jgi:hypothetical protein
VNFSELWSVRGVRVHIFVPDGPQVLNRLLLYLWMVCSKFSLCVYCNFICFVKE